MSCAMCGFNEKALIGATWEMEFRHGYPSLNSLGTNSKHNHLYRTHRRQWEGLLKAYKHKITPAIRKRRLIITRGWAKGHRAYDYINLVGGAKPIVDVMVEYGYLYDDTPDWLEDYYLQRKSISDKGHIWIMLTELV